MPRSESPGDAWAKGLFLAYCAFMLTITLFLFPGDHPPPNLVPFRSIVHDVTAGGRRDFVVIFLGNMIAFIPFGYLYPFARGAAGRFWEPVLFCAWFSAIIEVAQYLSGRRVADVDDLILNTLGGLVGFGVYLLVRRSKARKLRHDD